jgi:hypothetical protein
MLNIKEHENAHLLSTYYLHILKNYKKPKNIKFTQHETFHFSDYTYF